MAYIQFITHPTERYSYFEGACAALQGGCKWIQLRMKEASLDEIEQVALALKPLCQKAQARLLLNDHVELAFKLGLDGVHLGLKDMPVAKARQLVGPDFIVGATAHDWSDVTKQIEQGADYIGLGPFRYTSTKKNIDTLLGKTKIENIMQQLHKEECKVPVVAIGGILLEDLPSLLQTGVDGVAISGAIVKAEDPIAMTRQFVNY